MKITYSYYVLDLVHRGHLLQMKNAKAMGDISIVGILTNKATMEKKPKPILSFDERMLIAQAIRYNDVVIPQDTYSPIPNLKRIRPDIHFESASHSEKDIKKVQQVLNEWKGRVITTPYYPSISSTNIKRKVIKCKKTHG